MCIKCDNPEGNMCKVCEQEHAEIKQQSLYGDDGWWPMMSIRRSINSMSGEVPEGFEYV